MNTQDAYNELVVLFRELNVIGGISGILGWDQRVVMPPKGSTKRSRQVSWLRGESHKRITNPKIGELLSILEEDRNSLNAGQLACLREWRRTYEKQTKLSPELVKELTKTRIESYQIWVQAREEDNFTLFEPILGKMIDLQRQVADSFGYEKDIYDPLLDSFESHMKTSEITVILDKLKKRLVPFVQRIFDKIPSGDNQLVSNNIWPIEKQKEFTTLIIKQFGFDFEAGRIDPTVHPFCSGQYGDVRVTTRYKEHDFRASLLALMHECGHALYGQGLNEEHWGTPLGEAVSSGVHESQSRLWENFVGRSRHFWVWALHLMKQYFPDQLVDYNLDQIYRAVNEVKRSLIRVEADEVTYNLHIILRFELELGIFHNEIKIHDLPHLWKEKSKSYLGIEPPTDREGVLQDVHWGEGLFGYFPTYSLGNIIAAQWMNTIEQQIPNLYSQFEKGDFSELLNWLRKNIHQKGNLLISTDLVKDITGNPIDPDFLMDYLERKFTPVYLES